MLRRQRGLLFALLTFTLLSSACTAAQRRAGGASYVATTGGSASTGRERRGDDGLAEHNVPRVACYDGTLAISCSLERANTAQCCANQGGVYRDAWGNVVAY